MTEPINYQVINQTPGQVDQVVIPYFQDDISDIPWISGEITKGFSAKEKENYSVFIQEQSRSVILLGLGKSENKTRCFEIIRHFVKTQNEKLAPELIIDLRHLADSMVYQCVLGISLSEYMIGVYKTEAESPGTLKRVNLLVSTSPEPLLAKVDEALHTAAAVKSTCALVDAPGNIKTPQYLGQWAVESGKAHGYSVEVLDQEELHKQNLHALLAVGRGSEHPSILIKAVYTHPDLNDSNIDLGLVGKGVTFDTGGISIKKATNMHYMKSDMGGAAAVLGAIELIARLKLPINVVAIVPVAENSVDSLSIRPGDVIQSHAGKSIEIIDTDAEGRLILADAISFIQENYHPEVLIDLATLTGSCVAALGYAAAGLFTNDDDLADSISKAGTRTMERAWRLPLWNDYQDALSSDIADVKNLSGKPVAGAITAAKFLEYFVTEEQTWAHLDIAGVAFGDSDYAKMKSASGYGVRLLVDFAQNLISTKS